MTEPEALSNAGATLTEPEPLTNAGAVTTEPEACLNCGATMSGPYCANCGQKQAHTDPTLREFLHEATAELTQLDGKVPSTLTTLFSQPGRLTLDFLAGRRARWLSPLRLYLICSVAYFLSGPLLEAITHRGAREIAKITISDQDGSTTLTPEGQRQVEEGLPARIFGAERLQRAAVNSAQLNRAFASAFPKAMFALLPLFALLTSIAWRRRPLRYPAHLYFALHFHAALFAALTVATVLTAVVASNVVTAIVGSALFAYVVWYGLVALHRVFSESWVRTIVKSTAIAVVYLASMFTVSIAILAYAVLTM